MLDLEGRVLDAETLAEHSFELQTDSVTIGLREY